MIYIVIVFVPVLVAALLASLIVSFFKRTKISADTLNLLSVKGSKSVLHHNSSSTVEICMDGAKKTLQKHNLEIDCAKFVKNY